MDSDEAYETAAKESADYIKKNPGKPVVFLMELSKRFADVTWRVIWGDSVGTSDYSVFVDGTTGKYLERCIRRYRRPLGVTSGLSQRLR